MAPKIQATSVDDRELCEFFLNAISSCRVKDVHSEGLFEMPQVCFNLPSPTIQRCEFRSRVRGVIQQGRDESYFARPHATHLDLIAKLTKRERGRERLPKLFRHPLGPGCRLVIFNDLIMATEPSNRNRSQPGLI